MRPRSLTSFAGIALAVGTLVAPAASASGPGPRIPALDRLFPGGQLTDGQALLSTSSQVYLDLSGGVLALVGGCGTVLWSPPVTGVSVVAYSQTGVLKLKDDQGRVLAAYGGPKAHPKRLVVQNDGNLVATAARGWYFQTGTHWSPPGQPAHGASASPRCR